MAGFCRNCGSPLADGQGFCTKCGTPISGPPRAAAQPPAPPASAAPPAPRPQTPPPQAVAAVPQAAAAAPAKKGGSVLVKVLVAVLVVIFLICGAIGATIWYGVHRLKQKAQEMGLDEISKNTGPVLGGADPCTLLSKEDVGQVVKMEVVRAERVSGQNEGCQYSVMGNYTDMVASHLSLMQQAMAEKNQQQLSDAQKQQMDEITKSFFHGMGTQQGSPSAHPGEAPVFQFGVSNTGAKAQMSMTRMAFGRMAPAFTELPGIGDEAFDVGNALIVARKGDNAVTVLYMMCPCGKDDAAALARKIVGNL